MEEHNLFGKNTTNITKNNINAIIENTAILIAQLKSSL